MQNLWQADMSRPEGTLDKGKHQPVLLVNSPTGSSGIRKIPVIEVRRMDSGTPGWWYYDDSIYFSFCYWYTFKNLKFVEVL